MVFIGREGKEIMLLRDTNCDFIERARDAGAIVGQGGRSLEKGTCADYDVIMTS